MLTLCAAENGVMETFTTWKQRHSTRSPYRQAQTSLRGLFRTNDPENRDVSRISNELNAMRQFAAVGTASIATVPARR